MHDDLECPTILRRHRKVCKFGLCPWVKDRTLRFLTRAALGEIVWR